MTKETMNVHKALAELKIIDDRIYKAIEDGTFVLANKHSNEKIKGKTIATVKDDMKACFNRVTDLMNRRNAIKRAVVLSNASTKVNVNGEEMTVAEAIELKNHGVDFKKNLVDMMTRQKNMADRTITMNSGEDVEKKAEKYILDVIASQPKDGKMAVDSKAMKDLREAYIANNTYDLLDPLDVENKIKDMTDEINGFLVEVDAVLSTSNATTNIEIEY